MKKRIKNSNKKNIMYKMMPCLLLLIIISLSVGYSAFSSKLNISKTVVHVRLKESIRITGLSVSEVSNNAISNYNEYNKENINAEVYLPEKKSSVTYKVEVTNFGNMEMGILDITGLPDNLDYEITDYKLGTKICDNENKCKLGISKEFYITLKYKEDSIVSENELENHYDLKLDFDFKQAFNVKYEGIEVNDYPTSILKTGTLEVEFGENGPSDLQVLMDGIKIFDYTYENGKLTIPNAMGDIEIVKILKTTLVQYIENLYNPSSTTTYDSIEYKYDMQNNLMKDRFGGISSNLEVGNIRYRVSAFSNNYIDIGDRDSENNPILWRIVGLFRYIQIVDDTGNVIGTKDLIKIVRADSIGRYAWDYTSSGSYSNNWGISSLKQMLNDSYYNSSTTQYYSRSSGPVSVDFSSSGLSPSAREKIENVTWNLGGWKDYYGVTGYQFYTFERGSLNYNNYPTTWNGKIGLMYASDFEYFNLFDSAWTITNSSGDNRQIFVSTKDLDNIVRSSVYNENFVYPTAFLKADVLINGEHTGSIEDPYIVVSGNSIDQEEDNNFIKFNIEGIQYKAKQNMTWNEWINSEYNPGMFSINGNYITYGAFNVSNSSGSSNYTNNSNTITSGKNYYLYYNGLYGSSSSGGSSN